MSLPVEAANDNRPSSFDASLMAYLPLIERMACKMENRASDRDDLVNETVAFALENWANLRFPAGMSKWLYFNMRYIQGLKIANSARTVADVDGKIAATIRVLPNQEDAVSFRETMDSIPPKLRGTMGMVAQGYYAADIAKIEGVTRQAISLRIADARRLLEAA